MGSIETKGYAKRSVESDRVRVTLTFEKDGKTLSEAVNSVRRDTERFLEKLQELGVDITKVQFKGDNSGRMYYGDGERQHFSRMLEFLAGSSPAFLDRLSKIIEEEDLSVSYNSEPLYSKEKELRQTLLMEAVEDSRKKAEKLAALYGQKVVGIDKISYQDHNTVMVEEAAFGMADRKISLTEQLKNSYLPFEENVFVTWRIDE